MLAFIAVGILAWKSVALSDQMDDLSIALSKATSTSRTTTRPTTTTTADPWEGLWAAYVT